MNYEELKRAYDELNDFENSQSKKLLIKNMELNQELKQVKAKYDVLYKENADLQRENKYLKDEIEVLRLYRRELIEDVRELKAQTKNENTSLKGILWYEGL